MGNNSFNYIKFFLIISLLLNFLLLIFIIKFEIKNHAIEIALDRKGIIRIKQEHRSDYFTQQAWINSIKQLHRNFDIVFLGNSLTFDGDFQLFFQNKSIINLGLPGNCVQDIHRLIPLLTQIHPQKIFIMSGANDLLNCSLNDYINHYYELLKIIRKQIPNTQVFVQSILPMNASAGRKQIPIQTIKESNLKIKKIAESFNYTFINLYDLYAVNDEMPTHYTYDGIHLKKDAYIIWFNKIKKYMD